MTANHITSVHIRSLPVLDQDEALAFYTTHLGFETRDDIDLGFMRWLTIGVPGQDTSLLLEVVGGPQHDEATATQVRELLAKGALGGLFLLSDDARATFAALRDAGVEITQEPVEQPYGTDFGCSRPVRQPHPHQPAQCSLTRRHPGGVRASRLLTNPDGAGYDGSMASVTGSRTSGIVRAVLAW